MKLCAQNPILPEFSLCGDAFDLPQTENEDEFDFVKPGQIITCNKCISSIAEIHRAYTIKGKMRKL